MLPHALSGERCDEPRRNRMGDAGGGSDERKFFQISVLDWRRMVGNAAIRFTKNGKDQRWIRGFVFD